MKFSTLSMMVAVAGIAFAAPAFAAGQTYTADMIKQICSGKKDPAKCAAHRKVGDPVSKRDQSAASK